MMHTALRYDRIMALRSSRTVVEPSRSSSRNMMGMSSGGVEDVVYVAVGKEMKEFKFNLMFALQHSVSVGNKICILHVHEPSKMIPILGTKFPASSMKEEEVRAYREIERQDANKILDEFLTLCHQAGAQAEKLYYESDKIKKGIVELISLRGIKKLVIGAAADKHYSNKMTKIKSRKAMYVHLQAPAFCRIQFVCKGQLIRVREACLYEAHANIPPPSPQTQNIRGANRRLVQSDQLNGIDILSGSNSMSDAGGTWSPFERSYSTSSSSIDVTSLRTEADEYGLGLNSSLQMKDYPPDLSPSSSSREQRDGSADDSLYIHLEQAINDAANARREAFREAIKRGKAEKELDDLIRRAKISETLYAEELKYRKETEAALEKEREELDNVKNQVNEMMEKVQIAHNKELDLENKIAESDLMVKELEQKILSAVELLHNYKIDRDDLRRQRDEAVKEVEEMMTKQVEATSKQAAQLFTEFSFSEIAEATQNFDPSLKIGEVGFASSYKGLICHTEVAIKVLHSHDLHSPVEFQREVDVLSKMRHPNLVTLIGACPDASILVYDYVSNGSLEDRLVCKANSLPLSWKTRIRIATELCSALLFLHSNKPCRIIHGDLKPMNILLDAHYVSKLAEFGSCHFLPRDEKSKYNENCFYRADGKNNHEYMDPEFLTSGKLTTKSDVYSFGIVLLRLLTGKPVSSIRKEVQFAIDNGKLRDILDPEAGEWPFVQAEQLAQLALRCCNTISMNRPDLASDVWRVLEPMRASSGGLPSFCLGSGEKQVQPPSHFICPIFQEVMEDPQVAADGFTYEAEALRGWMDSGHDTSPMTNLKLSHQNLIPNRALRSAIQEWLQQH